MKYNIREMFNEEYHYLEVFLYHAIFNLEPDRPLPMSIVENPLLQIYIRNFGSLKGDYCLCIENSNLRIIGAVWIRNIEGYGSIDSRTPELSMSLLPEFQGKGLGRILLRKLLIYLESIDTEQISLSVQKENYALKFYLSKGFEIYLDKQNEYILVYRFKKEIK